MLFYSIVECWDNILTDIRTSDSSIGQCFYQKNSSLSAEHVPSMFTDEVMGLPDKLFNPLEYADFIGIDDESAYSMGSFKLRRRAGQPMIRTRTLGM